MKFFISLNWLTFVLVSLCTCLLVRPTIAANPPGNTVLKYTITVESDATGASNLSGMSDQTIWRTVKGTRSDLGSGITLINPANKPMLITLFADKKQAFESPCPIGGLDVLGSHFVGTSISTIGDVHVKCLGYTCQMTAGTTQSGSDSGYAADYTAKFAGYTVTLMSVYFSSDGHVSISRVKDLQILRHYKGNPLAIPHGYTLKNIPLPKAPPVSAAPTSASSPVEPNRLGLCPFTDADGTVRYAPAGTKVTFKDGTVILLPIKSAKPPAASAPST